MSATQVNVIRNSEEAPPHDPSHDIQRKIKGLTTD